MSVELRVPAMGESISEVQIGAWLKQEGDYVDEGQPVVEIESEKATVELPAPVSGTIAKITKQRGEKALVDDVIGVMEPGAKRKEKAGKARPEQGAAAPKEAKAGVQEAKDEEAEEKQEQTATALPEVDEQPPVDSKVAVMPAARRLLSEQGLKAEDVEGTGPGGRILKEDVIRHVEQKSATPPPPRVAPSVSQAERAQAAAKVEALEEVVAMSPMRRTIAQRLVEAQQVAALLTTFNEVDMSAVIALRQEHNEAYQRKYGIKLGFMSFFVKGCVDALKQFPAVNAEVRGDDIVYKNHYDIGVAVGGGKGLVVPVLRDADRLSFAEVEQRIADFAERAQANRLSMEELSGGTFTISNGGIYGSMLSTPIINPPQSGILGMHVIQDRPVARDGQVVIRPMMYVALTYDHRVVDGREAVSWLKRLKDCIEAPTRILIEV
jgi:2-oxoglutarate dehydrogenase E2 component (dihydrolipoamide succinyltransferase)